MHMQGGSLDVETARTLSTVRGKKASPGAKLHHLAYYHGGPSRQHLYGARNNGAWYKSDPDSMGQYVEAAAALWSAYEGSEGGNGGAPAGGTAPGGPTTGMQQPGSTATAISPTFQTQISPQISPVFQQTQDSPGATQAATATQYMPGGMFAEGGSAAAAPGMSPYGGSSFPDFGATAPTKYGGFPVSPLDPVHLTDIRDFRDAGSMVRDIRESAPFNWTPVYWAAGIGTIAVVALAVLGRQRKPAAKAA